MDGVPSSGSSGEPHRSLWLQPLPVLSSCTCSSPQITFFLPVQRLCLTSAVPRALSGTDLATGAGTVPSQHPRGVGSVPGLLLPQPSPCPHGGCALAVPKLCQGPLELSMKGAPAPGNISQLCFIHRSRCSQTALGASVGNWDVSSLSRASACVVTHGLFLIPAPRPGCHLFSHTVPRFLWRHEDSWAGHPWR